MKTKKRLQVNIDEQLAKEVDDILDDLGMNPTTLVTALYKRVAAEGRVPFELKLSEVELAKRKIQQLSSKKPVVYFENGQDFEDWLVAEE